MAFKPYPIVVGPILKEKVWGGKNLEKYTGMTGKNIGEAWMLADQSENRSVINNGAYRGMTISELINRFPAGVMGKKLVDKYGKKFPLLFKYLDTNDRISIQVHPDDAYAKRRGYPAGKTEMWYVLSNKFRSSLLVGFKSRQDKKSLERMVAGGTLVPSLKKYRPKKADCFFIPAGTVHTIGKGNVIFEVQQNSDVTYRIYDWGRHNLAEDRHLNIQDAVASVNFNSDGGKIEARAKKYAQGFRVRPLAHCGYFLCDEVTVEKDLKYWYNKNLPLVLTVAEGEVSITLSDGTETKYKKGGIVFIPYSLKDILFKIKDKTRLIVTQAR